MDIGLFWEITFWTVMVLLFIGIPWCYLSNALGLPFEIVRLLLSLIKLLIVSLYYVLKPILQFPITVGKYIIEHLSTLSDDIEALSVKILRKANKEE